MMPAEGHVLADRFVLVRRLGEGGFGVVYEGRDLRDGGRIALKLLRRSEPAWLVSFKREFRTLAGIRHPNLVALDQLFSHEDQWFFTMELVDGHNFLEYVRGTSFTRRLPPGLGTTSTLLPEQPQLPTERDERHAASPELDHVRLRAGLRQLFEGLLSLHAAGKVHRDIKPANVLTTPEGRIVLIDFGMVTAAFSTTESMAGGTPAYMAPEQATSTSLGPAADMYSAGLVLYEALTGRLPFEGTALEILLAKQRWQPPVPALLLPEAPDDLSSLCVRLLQRDPGARPSAQEVLRALGAAAAPRARRERADVQMGGFVGRREELRMLFDAFEDSGQGRLASVIISGDSGIGKTHLVRRFIAQLLAEQPDTLVLEGRCHEREAIPYKVLDGVIDALSRRLSHMPALEVAAVLPTRRALLGRLFPSMLRVPGLAATQGAGSTEDAASHDLRQRAFLELQELFMRLTIHHRVVVVIDDLQWADEDGLRALETILGAPDAPSLLFVGNLRVSRSSGDRAYRSLVARIPCRVRHIDLRGLSSVDARELAVALVPAGQASEGVVERIALEAGGHPLFVEELSRHAAQHRSTLRDVRLDEVIWSRVVELEALARALVEVVAVAGKPIPQDVAASAAALAPADFQREVAILRACRLLRTSGSDWEDAIDTYHDRIRESVLARLHADRLRALHEAIAVALEAAAKSDAESLAVHFRESGNAARGAHYAELAGDEALRTFAFERAVEWFEQALELRAHDAAERRGVRIKLGDALALAGRGVLAARHLEQAAEESPARDALELRRRAAEQLLNSGHLDEGIAGIRRVLALIGMRMPSSRLGTLLALFRLSWLVRLRGLAFVERSRGRASADELVRIDTCWSIARALGFADSMVGFVFSMRALLLALRAGDLNRILPPLAMTATFWNVAGNRRARQGTKMLRLALRLSRRSDDRRAHVVVGIGASLALFFYGRFRRARHRLLQATHLAEAQRGIVFERTALRMILLQSLGFLGRFRELCSYQEQALRDAEARGDVYATVGVQVGFPNLAWLIKDRPDLAEEALRAATAAWSQRGFHTQHFDVLCAHVSLNLYRGEVEQAYERARELSTRARRSLLWRIQVFRLRVLYGHGSAVLALLEAGIGDRQALLRQLAGGARSIERERMAWMSPFARVLRAGLALQAGDGSGAVRALRAAAGEFLVGDMAAYSVAASERAARLQADSAATDEMERASTWLRKEGVVAPERMLAVLIPGLTRVRV
jgi:eukaryotic-like serine/threonine-protein kinase